MSQPTPYQPAPPPPSAVRQPVRVEPVPGTPFGLAIFDAPPATSGPAIGALVAGIASILVSFLVGCVALADVAWTAGTQSGGWGAVVGGAFAALAAFLGFAGIGLGLAGIRQTRPVAPAGGRVGGRGLAVAGVTCGSVGLGIAICSIALVLSAVVA